MKVLRCPRCHSTDIRRSRVFDVLFAILSEFSLHPFRCRSCRKKFFRLSAYETRWDVQGPPPKLVKFPLPKPEIQPKRKRDWAALLSRSGRD